MPQKSPDKLFKRGLKNRIKRYKKLSNTITQNIRALVLRMLTYEESIMFNVVTSAYLPESTSVIFFIERMHRQCNVVYTAKSPLLDKNMLQINNMRHLTKKGTRDLLETIKTLQSNYKNIKI